MTAVKDEAIAGLDLEPIKRKLMRGKSGAAWSCERADAAEQEYRRFLFLMKMFPHELAAPSMDVDRFWHHHIIDTTKYAHDCEAVFGYFLHRYPYLGLRDDGPPSRLQAGARMRELYCEVFGQQENARRENDGSPAFAMAVHPATEATVGRRPACDDLDEQDAPDHAGKGSDLLGQIRFVVTENQRYDRMAEPVM